MSSEGPISRLEEMGRLAVRYGRLLAREAAADDLGERARSLTFSTMLALVPVLVLAFSLFSAFGGLKGTEEKLYALLSDHLIGSSATDILSILRSLSENVRSTTVSTVSIVVLVYSVTVGLSTIEGALGDIWKAPRRRSLAQRLPVYITLVVLGPALIAASITLATQLEQIVRSHAEALGVIVVIEWTLTWVAPLAIDTLAFMALYVFMTSMRVQLRPALIGAALAAVLFTVAKEGFQVYLESVGAGSFNRIYGSLAAAPIFMIGLYISWFVVLIGAEVASTLQHFERLERKNVSATFRASTADLIAIAATVARHFGEGRGPQTVEAVSEQTGLPDEVVAEVLARLAETGLMAETDPSDTPAYLPAKPPEQITMREIADVGTGLALRDAMDFAPSEVLELLGDVESELDAALERRTLAMVAG